MAQQKIKIVLYGKGALKDRLVTFALEMMPEAVFYERSNEFMAFRKREIALGKTKDVDPTTAVRDMPLEKVDVQVHYEQTEIKDDDFKATVTATHRVNQ